MKRSVATIGVLIVTAMGWVSTAAAQAPAKAPAPQRKLSNEEKVQYEALKALTAALQDIQVRPFAVAALGKLKDPRAVDTLVDVVTGKSDLDLRRK